MQRQVTKAMVEDDKERRAEISAPQAPPSYICSITGQIMREPVFALDGHTYEREAIKRWLKKHNTSPKTGATLKSKILTDNHDKKSDIAEFLQTHPELYAGEEVYLPRSWVKRMVAAIKTNDIAEVKKWLDRDPRLLSLDLEKDYTAWHLASEFGSVELTSVVLEQLQKRKQLNHLIAHPTVANFKPLYLNVLLQKVLEEGDKPQSSLLLKLGAVLELPNVTARAIAERDIIELQTVIGNHEAVSCEELDLFWRQHEHLNTQINNLLLEAEKLKVERTYLADLLQWAGEYQEHVVLNNDKAFAFYHRSLQLRQALLTGNNADVAQSLYNIGCVYYNKAKYSKALRYAEKSLGMRQAVYGDKHPIFAKSLNFIGNIYNFQGDYAQALKYYRQSLAISKAIYGDSHPAVASSIYNMSNIFSKAHGDRELLLLVNHVLNDYEEDDTSSDNLCRDINNTKEYMYYLMIMLAISFIPPLNDFQISRNLVIALNKVLTAKDNSDFILSTEEKEDFKTLDSMFGYRDFLTILDKLRLLVTNNSTMREAVIKMQKVFSGKCLAIAAEHDVLTRDRALMFQKRLRMVNKETNIEAGQLKQGVKGAEEVFEPVGKFCHRYRISY